MSRVIQIISLADGRTTDLDGQYVVEYDPGRDGPEWGFHIITTTDIDKATRFDDPITVWRSVDPRQPERPDGKPNRPLTAWTINMFDPTQIGPFGQYLQKEATFRSDISE
jgi:hypothetical protein